METGSIWLIVAYAQICDTRRFGPVILVNENPHSHSSRVSKHTFQTHENSPRHRHEQSLLRPPEVLIWLTNRLSKTREQRSGPEPCPEIQWCSLMAGSEETHPAIHSIWEFKVSVVGPVFI